VGRFLALFPIFAFPAQVPYSEEYADFKLKNEDQKNHSKIAPAVISCQPLQTISTKK
jgi:hypothetical protein